MFNDTITLLHKKIDGSYENIVIQGVQWSDKYAKEVVGNRTNIGAYTTITFPEGTYENVELSPSNEEDALFYGVITDKVIDEKGKRVSDILNKYPRSGRIKSVNNNTNREFLKNIKVVIT